MAERSVALRGSLCAETNVTIPLSQNAVLLADHLGFVQKAEHAVMMQRVAIFLTGRGVARTDRVLQRQSVVEVSVVLGARLVVMISIAHIPPLRQEKSSPGLEHAHLQHWLNPKQRHERFPLSMTRIDGQGSQEQEIKSLTQIEQSCGTCAVASTSTMADLVVTNLL